MYREIIIPTDTKQTIEFPEEFVGKQVEVISFPIEERENNQPKIKEAFNFWKKHSINMSNFKFDRSEKRSGKLVKCITRDITATPLLEEPLGEGQNQPLKFPTNPIHPIISSFRLIPHNLSNPLNRGSIQFSNSLQDLPMLLLSPGSLLLIM